MEAIYFIGEFLDPPSLWINLLNNVFIIKANSEGVKQQFQTLNPYAMTLSDVSNLRCLVGGVITMSKTIKLLGNLTRNGIEIIKCTSVLPIQNKNVLIFIFVNIFFIYCVITFCVSKIYLTRCTFYQKIFGFVFKGKPSAVKIYGKNDSFWEMFDLAKSRTFVCEQGLRVWDCIVFFFRNWSFNFWAYISLRKMKRCQNILIILSFYHISICSAIIKCDTHFLNCNKLITSYNTKMNV